MAPIGDVGNRPAIYPPPDFSQVGPVLVSADGAGPLPCPATRKGPDRRRGWEWSVVLGKKDAGGTAV